MPHVLEQELATFSRELPRLLKEEASRRPLMQRWALVRGDKVDSIWDTEGDAIRAGYRIFGEVPFLAKKISEKEEPAFCLHNLVIPCQESAGNLTRNSDLS